MRTRFGRSVMLWAVLFAGACKAGRASEAQQAQGDTATKLAQQVAELESQADAVEVQRATAIKPHFPAMQNALETCIRDKGGAPIRPDFFFGSETALAYKTQLGEPLARRFIAYIDRASSCTAFSSPGLRRAIIPALPYLQNTAQLTTLIAAAGDVAAREGDNSDENFAAKAAALTSTLH